MIVPNQMIETKWNNSIKQYYISKGYKYTKIGDAFLVKVEDLSKGSHCKVQVICDYCNEIVYKPYCKISKQEKHCCKKCSKHKQEEVFLEKYGVKNPNQLKEVKEKKKQTMLKKYGVEHHSQIEETKEKRKQTCLKRYGVEYTTQSKEVKEKIKQTNLKRYGVEYSLQNKEIKEKQKQTMLKKYGVEYISQSKEIQEKIIQTNLERYGVESPFQSEKIKEKINYTLYQNGTAPSSKNQRHLCELFNGELNYPIDYYSLDIAFINDKIYIEYDGGGHALCVKLGNITEKEFKRKEVYRDKYIRNKGWKLIRIISNKDKLLFDNQLLQLFNHCKEYLLTTNHTWIYIDIDEMKVKCNVYEKDIEEILIDEGLNNKSGV